MALWVPQFIYNQVFGKRPLFIEQYFFQIHCLPTITITQCYAHGLKRSNGCQMLSEFNQTVQQQMLNSVCVCVATCELVVASLVE